MRFVLLSVLLLGLAAQAAPTPTVIVDIHQLGAQKVAELRAASGVQWSAEFGNELLLGVSPISLKSWTARADTRLGPPRLHFDEVVVRDHVCTLHNPEPALALVGGYEILRKPPSLAKATIGPRITGEPLPADGVVAREVHNWPDEQKAQLGGKGVPNPLLQSLVDRVDAERWFGTLTTLAGFDRNSFNPNLSSAHDWIQGQFAAAGLQVDSFPFQLSGGTSCPGQGTVNLANPIGIKAGTDLADEWVVVGAHYDSRNSNRCDGTANPQPGANDNGSGCAGVIELARVMQTVDTRRSILFMCFAGEEQGLVGSRRYVESLQANGDINKLQYMINLDMIGYANSDSLDTRVETVGTFSAELVRFAQAAATYAPELNVITSSSTQAYSDHWYFLDAGIPGAFTWENGAGIYPQYHRAGDLPQAMLRARELAGGILKMDTAILAEEAQVLAALFADGFE